MPLKLSSIVWMIDTMAQLVDRLALRYEQLALLIERSLLEEEANLVGALEEVAVLHELLLRGREDRALLGRWLKVRDQLVGTMHQRLGLCG